MDNEAEDAIEVAKAAMPTLTIEGIGIYDNVLSGPKFDLARTRFRAEAVATAIAYLRLHPKIKTPRLNSYGLKHIAERWGELNGMAPYITNGELIVAAIYLGFPIKHRSGLTVLVAAGAINIKHLKGLNIMTVKGCT